MARIVGLVLPEEKPEEKKKKEPKGKQGGREHGEPEPNKTEAPPKS